jgi:hypothetical protein
MPLWDDEDDSTHENEKERLNRQLVELLNELRIVLPGVQVMFAFLLTVPFTQRFDTLSSFHRDLLLGCLVTTALATAALIAPTSFHRLRFRQREKDRLLIFGNVMALVGIVLVGLAMIGVILLVTDVVFSRTASVIVTGATAAAFIALWFGVPLWSSLSGREDDADGRTDRTGH